MAHSLLALDTAKICACRGQSQGLVDGIVHDKGDKKGDNARGLGQGLRE